MRSLFNQATPVAVPSAHDWLEPWDRFEALPSFEVGESERNVLVSTSRVSCRVLSLTEPPVAHVDFGVEASCLHRRGRRRR